MDYLVQQEVEDVHLAATGLPTRRLLRLVLLVGNCKCWPLRNACRLGDIRRYCDLVASVGHQDRALAAAPAVSVSFYQSLCVKFAEEEIVSVHRRLMGVVVRGDFTEWRTGNMQRAVELFLFAGQPQRAAALLQQLDEPRRR